MPGRDGTGHPTSRLLAELESRIDIINKRLESFSKSDE